MRALAALLCCFTAACTGSIVTPAPKPPPDIDPIDVRPGPFVPEPAGLRLLTARQYESALASIFGPAAARRVGAWSTSLSAAQGGVSASQVETYETAALEVAAALFAPPADRTVLTGCNQADDPCTRAWVERIGRLAFRRPLTPDELARYLGVATVATSELQDPWKGLELVTAALLQSPHFLYRVELPSAGAFDAFALASRLSFTLVNAPPDAALLDAASDGSLLQPDVLRSHARRLIADPRARAALEQLLADWLQLDDLATLQKDPAHFANFDAALAGSMRDELVATVQNHLLDEDRDFRDLFENRVTFVDGRLAALYGLQDVPVGAPLTRVTLPDDGPRAGLLGFAGVLALQATPVNTSPTLRGKFVRTTFLCQGIPPPPPGVDTTLPPPMPGLSTRARLDQHRTDPACAACHSLMDPIGFGLENFDAIGAHRVESQGVAIDASGTLDGTRFDDARGLGRALKGHSRAAGCMVRQVYRYALGHVEAPGEALALWELEHAFAAEGYKLEPLLEALVLHQAFRGGGAMKLLSRRTFLRGATAGVTASIALPRLEAMLDGNGIAYAQGAALPKRFVVWFWGNGNEPGAWTPAATGTGWVPQASQLGLVPIKNDLTLVSGMKLNVRKVNNPHVEGVVGLLAGGNPQLHSSYTGANGDWNFMTVPGPSADQVVAAAIGGTTQFRSLELGVTPVHGSSGPGQAVSYISHSAPYTPNPCQIDPAVVFQRLFGMGLPNPQAPDAPLKRVRASILDAVKADAVTLKQRLGVNDQKRLDAHLDGVRALEQRINAMAPPVASACRVPGVPLPGASVSESARVMGELGAMALACDLTRVMSFEFSSPASHQRFDAYPSELTCGGEAKSFHEYEHCAGYDTPVRGVLKYFVDQYAAFVQSLKAMPEGAGSLLDNCCVLGCSELSGGWDHQHDNMPLLVAGRAGGALTPGKHLAATGEDPARLMLALMRAVGAPVASWGSDQFATTVPLTGL